MWIYFVIIIIKQISYYCALHMPQEYIFSVETASWVTFKFIYLFRMKKEISLCISVLTGLYV